MNPEKKSANLLDERLPLHGGLEMPQIENPNSLSVERTCNTELFNDIHSSSMIEEQDGHLGYRATAKRQPLTIFKN